MQLTAPHEASVVMVANSDDPNSPNRTSFPSMFPEPAAEAQLARTGGLPEHSAAHRTRTPTRKSDEHRAPTRPTRAAAGWTIRPR